MKKFLALLIVILSIPLCSFAAELSAKDLVFKPDTSGKYIYCNNIEFITKVMGNPLFAEKGESKSIQEEVKIVEVPVKKEKSFSSRRIFVIVASIIVIIAGIIGMGAMII